MNKKEIRLHIKRALFRQPKASRRVKSQVITKRVLEDPFFQKSKYLCAYVSMPHEADTVKILSHALKSGKNVCVPLTKLKELQLEFYEIKNLKRDLRPGVMGILEPNPQYTKKADIKKIDYVLVPGLSFDKRCHRLGYGAGLYDRFLKKLSKKALKVGLAFDFQILERVPNQAHDIQVDVVITNKR